MAGLDEVFGLLAREGGERYGQEAVSQIEHALQGAALAEAAGASPAFVVATLFHDIGHLLHDDEEAAVKGVDMHHEAGGAAYLANWFGPEVTRPVRLHVDAKRYLCATEAGYFESLSPASVRSLELQGGPMGSDEAAAFARDPNAEAALMLRRLDEQAKVVGAKTPPLDYFRAMAEALLVPEAGRRRART
ncbi:MAG: HD domain-containing protein [Alphaproteobacteria bacterium]|nr:HD domain-containing protein [Alphaproteobacteria bacterium]